MYYGFGKTYGAGNQPWPWIHVRDAAGIIVHAVENGRVSGTVNAVAPQDTTHGEILEALAKKMGRNLLPSFFSAPEDMLRSSLGKASGQNDVQLNTNSNGITLLQSV